MHVLFLMRVQCKRISYVRGHICSSDKKTPHSNAQNVL